MTDRIKLNVLATGVPGLDTLLGGGLPELSFNILAGEPGCGKTTLAQQIMFGLVRPDRRALFFTALGEPPVKMLRYQQQFDFFDFDAVEKSITFINLAEDVHNKAISTPCCSASCMKYRPIRRLPYSLTHFAQSWWAARQLVN